MGFRNNLATRRDTQIKAAIGLVMAVLYFAFVISQFVAVDQAQRQPAYIQLSNQYSKASSQEFPKFTMCPTWKANATSSIELVNCIFVRTNSAPLQITRGTLSTQTIFTPQHGNTTWDACYDIDPSTVGADSSSFSDFIDCTITTDHHIMVYFYPDKTSTTTPQSNFEWHVLYQDVVSNIGLNLVKMTTPGGSTISSKWQNTVQFENDVIIEANKTIFTVQFQSTATTTYQEFYIYGFWESLGVIGGAGVIFAALYFGLTFCILHMLGIKPDDSTSTTKTYEPIDEQS